MTNHTSQQSAAATLRGLAPLVTHCIGTLGSAAMVAAASEIDRLRAEVERLTAERDTVPLPAPVLEVLRAAANPDLATGYRNAWANLRQALAALPPEIRAQVEGETPPPGSQAARDRGCICPVIDNHYGRGRPSSNGPQFIMTVGCPLHGGGSVTKGDAP